MNEDTNHLPHFSWGRFASRFLLALLTFCILFVVVSSYIKFKTEMDDYEDSVTGKSQPR